VQVTASFSSFRSSITQYADATNEDVRQHNVRLDAELRRLVAARRSRLLNQRQLVAGLPFQPEPFLEDAIYEDVLARIVSFASMVERSPRSG